MPPPDRPGGSPAEPAPLLPLPGAGAPSLGETLAWLDRHVNLEAIESGRAGRLGLPSLERISALVSRSRRSRRPTYPIVHVTGTNGKGSTSRMTAAILQACGLSVGTYSSPHLERINERLEFAGAEISDDSFVRVLGTLAELERFLGLRATWFELVTAAAFAWFADMAAEAAVVEVGLGGRYDATNVGRADVAVVTNVELDHTDILGHDAELDRRGEGRDREGAARCSCSARRSRRSRRSSRPRPSVSVHGRSGGAGSSSAATPTSSRSAGA